MPTVDVIPQPHFGERLRRLRLGRGLRQADLAGGAVSASYVSRIESGTRSVPPHVAQLLAERLGVDLAAFAGDREALLTRLLAEAQEQLVTANHDAAATTLRSALAQADGAPLPVLWLIRQGLCTATRALTRTADWREHQDALIALAQRAGSPDLLTQAYTGLSNGLRGAGDIAGAHAAADTAVRHSKDPEVSAVHELEARMALIAAETETGRAADAARGSAALLASIGEDVPPAVRARARWTAATSYVACERHDEALALLEEAIDELASGEDLLTWARLRMAIVSLAQRAGRPLSERIRAWFAEAAHVLRLMALPVHLVQLDVVEARLAFDEGDFARATRLSERALASELLSFRDRARTELLYAAAGARAGDRQGGMRRLRAVAERLDRAGARDLSAEAWRLLAEIAAPPGPADDSAD